MTIPRNLSFLAEGASSTGVLGTAKGGTNLTSFTVNGIPYATSSSALNTSSALQFDGSNLGLGVTPSAWASGRPAFEQVGGAVWSFTTGNFYMLQNTYFDGVGFKYKNTAAATSYQQGSGIHYWYTASSGTSGTAVTLNEVMRISNSGGVSIGNTTDPGTSNLSVTGTITSAAHTANSFIPSSSTVPTNGMYLPAANSVALSTNSTIALRIDSAQKVGIGVTPSYVLDVLGNNVTTFTNDIFTANFTGGQGNSAYNSGNSGAGISFSGNYNSSGQNTVYGGIWCKKNNTTDSDYGAYLAFGTRTNGSAGTDMERMRIDSTGNIYGTSGTTSMTDGFFYIPAASGAPSGVPTAISGHVPMYYDSTNNNFYVYNGAWKKVLLV